MSTPEPDAPELQTPDQRVEFAAEPTPGARLRTRADFSDHEDFAHDSDQSDPGPDPEPAPDSGPVPPSPLMRILYGIASTTVWTVGILAVLLLAAYLIAGPWLRSATRAALPQLDGSLVVPGLTAPVTVARDAQGVPYIRAASADDLIRAQGFITAQDRLFQMDTLRRHAAGELAAILGSSLLQHDRLQRTLQLRAAADRALAQLPDEQRHMLELYADGVNAQIHLQIAQQSAHLPPEFRILHYTPAPWTPRDSMLVYLAMFEDLTNQWAAKLQRESLSARLPPELVPDLYPVGSWRDHPPNLPVTDLTLPGPPILQVPLDESQAALKLPALAPTTEAAQLIATLARTYATPPDPACADCRPGSNNWVVSGAHTASGKPLLANDMHLNLAVPGIWYEADLAVTGSANDLHIAGVTLPGLPLIVVGHNQHIAWGFTSLGADVQDVYIEQTRGSGSSAEFQATDGTWQPILHLSEHIVIRGAPDATLDVTATRHGDAITPVLTPLLKDRSRTLALRWTIYDPAVLQLPLMAIAEAHDWPSFNAAFAQFGGPSMNVVYADDAGHIGYHAVGRIPLRGPARNPALAAPLPDDLATPADLPPENATAGIRQTPDPLANSPIAATAPAPAVMASGPLSPVPLVPSPASEWSGYIPYDKLPAVFDPPDGLLATANSRIVPDDYPFPVALNWGAPYRNDRLWHMLAHRRGLTPVDMLALQSDIYSDFDHVLAQRLAYAVDHSKLIHNSSASDKRQVLAAADLLRNFSGQMSTDSPAAAIVSATHNVLWRVLLEPRLDSKAPAPAPNARQSGSIDPTQKSRANEIAELYTWGERDYALEQILGHEPPRWLPPHFASWDDLLASALDLGLRDAHAPRDLSHWRYGEIHTIELEHPVFSQSRLLQHLLRLPTGTGTHPQSGDGTTVKQTGIAFGPSERMTVDLADLDRSTLNLPLGQSGNPASPWYLDQFPAWLHGGTFPLPFTEAAVRQATTHTLTLTPR